jgi:hypothetical protein
MPRQIAFASIASSSKAASMVLSDILFDPLPLSAIDDLLKAAAGTNIPYRMRVQLQDDTMITTNTYGVTRSNNPVPGVTVLQVRDALSELYSMVQIRAPWFPSRLSPQLATAIILLSQRLGQYPPGGTTASGNIERRTFRDRGIQYRVDIENLRGHNLRV